ncbi:MAG TPA: hypothetical protein P5080_00515 [Candidatus Paceibacterota bacterium]|nr:hypothetical protein [Candidatus Pacearchaeota archaeon]HRZ50458.1 hypothetical protein [Candidatus Paceibacterota bacterium]HSA36179.1 hypothetical protein [Candidatus Paceibacterota bacterium]
MITLDEERTMVMRQIDDLSRMIDEIDSLLGKPPNGSGKELDRALKSSLSARKCLIVTLVKDSQFFLKQIEGIEFACRFRGL